MAKYKLHIESVDDVDYIQHPYEGKVYVYYNSDTDTFHSVNPDGTETESTVELSNYYTKAQADTNYYRKAAVYNTGQTYSALEADNTFQTIAHVYYMDDLGGVQSVIEQNKDVMMYHDLGPQAASATTSVYIYLTPAMGDQTRSFVGTDGLRLSDGGVITETATTFAADYVAWQGEKVTRITIYDALTVLTGTSLSTVTNITATYRNQSLSLSDVAEITWAKSIPTEGSMMIYNKSTDKWTLLAPGVEGDALRMTGGKPVWTSGVTFA